MSFVWVKDVTVALTEGLYNKPFYPKVFGFSVITNNTRMPAH